MVGVDLDSSRASTGLPAKLPPAACHNNCPLTALAMLSKLLAATMVVGTTLADEPVGTVIGIDLGTTYSVRQLLLCLLWAFRATAKTSCRLPKRQL